MGTDGVELLTAAQGQQSQPAAEQQSRRARLRDRAETHVIKIPGGGVVAGIQFQGIETVGRRRVVREQGRGHIVYEETDISRAISQRRSNYDAALMPSHAARQAQVKPPAAVKAVSRAYDSRLVFRGAT